VTLVAIAVGGALGALSRHGVAMMFGRATDTAFPWATFLVNITGSLVAGFLAHRFAGNELLRNAAVVGFLGAYTTFSAFSVQTIRLIENGLFALAATYVFVSLAAGLLAAGAGIALGSLR
jgi:fluoride exporter